MSKAQKTALDCGGIQSVDLSITQVLDGIGCDEIRTENTRLKSACCRATLNYFKDNYLTIIIKIFLDELAYRNYSCCYFAM